MTTMDNTTLVRINAAVQAAEKSFAALRKVARTEAEKMTELLATIVEKELKKAYANPPRPWPQQLFSTDTSFWGRKRRRPRARGKSRQQAEAKRVQPLHEK